MSSIQQTAVTFISRHLWVRLPDGLPVRLHFLDNWPDDRADLPTETVVFIHGLGANCHIWRPLMGEIAQSHPGIRCIALDLPGHGQSRRIASGDMRSCIAVIDLFLQALPGNGFHLVGHSFGAALLIHSDGNPLHTSRIKSYRLLAPVGIQPMTVWQKKLVKTIYDLPFLLKMGKKGSYESFCKYFHTYEAQYDLLWDWIAPDIDKSPERYFTTIHQLANSVMDQYELKTATIFERVQFIIGRNDIVVPSRAFAKNMKVEDLRDVNIGLFPNASWHFIDECGHYPQIEHSNQVFNLIISEL